MTAAAKPEPRRTPTLKLYDAVEALEYLDDLIEEHAEAIKMAGGDIEAVPAIAELLAFAEDAFQSAIERVGLKVVSLNAELKGVEVEHDRLTQMVRVKKNTIERLKDYLKRNLESRAITKVKTNRVAVRTQVNGQPSVRAESDAVMEELFASGSPYVKRTITYSFEYDVVVAAWKEDQLVRDAYATEIAAAGGDPYAVPAAASLLKLPKQVVVTKGTHVRVA